MDQLCATGDRPRPGLHPGGKRPGPGNSKRTSRANGQPLGTGRHYALAGRRLFTAGMGTYFCIQLTVMDPEYEKDRKDNAHEYFQLWHPAYNGAAPPDSRI